MAVLGDVVEGECINLVHAAEDAQFDFRLAQVSLHCLGQGHHLDLVLLVHQ